MNRHVPPHDLDRREAASFVPRAAPDFRRAARHSARVRFFRRALPISLVVAVLILAAIPYIASFKLKIELPFEVGHLTLSGTRLTMELPKLSGFTDDNRGYAVTAQTATQDLNAPDLVDLSDIEARLEMADKGWAKLEAKTGTLNVKSQFVTLGGGVDLSMNGGYGGHLQDAEVDVKKGTIVTEKPVVFTYLDGKLVADKLSVADRGQKALFEGNVQLDFRLSDLPGSKGGAVPQAVGPAALVPGTLGQGTPGVAAPVAQAQTQTGSAALGLPDAGAPRAIAPTPSAVSDAVSAMPEVPLPPRRPAQVR